MNGRRAKPDADLTANIEGLVARFKAGDVLGCRCGASIALTVDTGESRYALGCVACAVRSPWFAFEDVGDVRYLVVIKER